MSERPYKDLAVGDELPQLTLPPVDRTVLALFAGASGDHNPAHIDIDSARKAGMPDVFAQGMLGMAWLGRLLTNWTPQAMLLKYSVRFSGIVHLGNEITCAARVIEISKSENGRQIRLDLTSHNQFGQIKMKGEALVALP
jgi:acyl dehydratase